MSAKIVIAAYKPKDNQEGKLLDLVNEHNPMLVKLELATARTPIIGRSKDGTILEIFEWASESASSKAHEHPEVAWVWEQMGSVAEFVSLKGVQEFEKPFAHFEPLN